VYGVVYGKSFGRYFSRNSTLSLRSVITHRSSSSTPWTPGLPSTKIFSLEFFHPSRISVKRARAAGLSAFFFSRDFRNLA